MFLAKSHHVWWLKRFNAIILESKSRCFWHRRGGWPPNLNQATITLLRWRSTWGKCHCWSNIQRLNLRDKSQKTSVFSKLFSIEYVFVLPETTSFQFWMDQEMRTILKDCQHSWLKKNQRFRMNGHICPTSSINLAELFSYQKIGWLKPLKPQSHGQSCNKSSCFLAGAKP